MPYRPRMIGYSKVNRVFSWIIPEETHACLDWCLIVIVSGAKSKLHERNNLFRSTYAHIRYQASHTHTYAALHGRFTNHTHARAYKTIFYYEKERKQERWSRELCISYLRYYYIWTDDLSTVVIKRLAIKTRNGTQLICERVNEDFSNRLSIQNPESDSFQQRERERGREEERD